MTERRAASGSLQAPYLSDSPSYRLQAASRPLKAPLLAAKEGYVPFFDVVPPLAGVRRCSIQSNPLPNTLDRSRRKLVSTSIRCMTASLNSIDCFHFSFLVLFFYQAATHLCLFGFCLVLWVLSNWARNISSTFNSHFKSLDTYNLISCSIT